MGGEGSMAHMVTTLKNNNNLLSKRSHSFFKSSTENYKGHYKLRLKQFPKMTDEEILVLRKKLKREKRITDFKQVFILIMLVTLVSLGISYFI